MIEIVPVPHKLHGVVTVGERGQIVIPQEAREELQIEPGDKLLIFGGPDRFPSLVLMKSESVTRFVGEAIARLTDLERTTRQSEREGESKE